MPANKPTTRQISNKTGSVTPLLKKPTCSCLPDSALKAGRVQFVSAGLSVLFVATNRLLISLFSALLLNRRIRGSEITGMVLATAGQAITSVPALAQGHATWGGLAILAGGMVSYSLGNVFVARFNLSLPNLVINLWQVLLGGWLLVSFALLTPQALPLPSNRPFWATMLWLAVPVSIVAMNLRLALVRKDAVHAGKWLYLTPLSGYASACFLLDERITPGFLLRGAATTLKPYSPIW